MSEKNRNPDELITLAGDILTDMTAADLEKTDTQTMRVPRRFHMKMLRVIRSHGAGRNGTLRTAAIILIVSAAVLTAALGNETIRADIWNTVASWFSDYISIGFEDFAETSSVDGEFTKRRPSWVPEDYAETVKTDSPALYALVWKVGDVKVMSYSQEYKSDNSQWIDSETCTLSRVSISGHDALLAVYDTEGEHMTLVWSDDTYQYPLSVYDKSLSRDDVIRIAESVG